jgi:hypothetical protein
VVRNEHPAQRRRQFDLSQHGGGPRQGHPRSDPQIDLGHGPDRVAAGQHGADPVVGPSRVPDRLVRIAEQFSGVVVVGRPGTFLQGHDVWSQPA